ncbi:MAG: hypothetical protein R3E50_00230 [Halioglobus sp.]
MSNSARSEIFARLRAITGDDSAERIEREQAALAALLPSRRRRPSYARAS